MKVTSLLFLLLSTTIALTAQQSPLDSLLESIPESKDTIHYEHLIKIADEINKTDRQKALPYYYQALDIVESLNDIERLGHINKFIGVNHLYLANNDSSKTFLEESSRHFANIGDDLRIIANNTNIALIHQRNNETEKAVQLYHKVISDSENIEEWIEVIFAKINLSSLLINQNDHKKALNYLNSINDDYDRFVVRLKEKLIIESNKNLSEKELNELVKKNDDYQFIKSNYPSIYINQGICYEELGSKLTFKSPQRQTKLDSAILFQTKAIESSNDNPYVASYAYNNLGSVYYRDSLWEKASENYKNAFDGFVSINDKRGQVLSLNSIGQSQFSLGNYSAADTSIRKSLQMAQAIDFIVEVKSGYESLSLNYEAQGIYDSAFVYLKKYGEIKDSIRNESRVDAIQKWETKYETEKEREEVARLALENDFKTQSQRTQLILFIVGIMGLLGLGLYLYTRYRLKKEREVAEYERTTNQAMAKFVPMEFVKSLGRDNIRDVALGDEVEKEVTVLFSDIRNFSSMSERMTPIENFRFVKRYVERMSPIVHSNGGFINQYIGDGIMAIFQNDPDDALQACIEMQTATESFNKELEALNQDPIRVGMGIHTGSLVMGIIGDENRQDAAIISDTVNSAARMESLTKSYGNKIVLSKSSIDSMKDANRFHLRGLGQTMVKGKSQPLDVYECYDADSIDLQSQKSASTKLFSEAVQTYYNRDFQKSLELFENIYSTYPEDRVAYSFIKRIRSQNSTKSTSPISGANPN